MFRYEFVKVPVVGGLKAGKTDTFETCKEIVAEKSKKGWELVQIIPVGNEKSGVGFLVNYTIIFKVEEQL